MLTTAWRCENKLLHVEYLNAHPERHAMSDFDSERASGTFSAAIETISYGSAKGVQITWRSISGIDYTVYFTDSLRPAWEVLSTISGSGKLIEWLDDGTETGTSPTSAGVLKRFYRLSRQP